MPFFPVPFRRMRATTALLGVSALFFLALSCGKINICGKDSKLIGTWVITDYTIGDSIVPLVDSAAFFPPLDSILAVLGIPLQPTVTFTESGTFIMQSLLDTLVTSPYRMERFERKCLLYIDSLAYRWQITRLNSNQMDISTYTLLPQVPVDTLIRTEILLENRETYTPL